ncbi:hypothetical protein BASA50_009540 [Batrachochytrium salamandrivorans]|uniref:Uncharacterized protein n=1 Tax=Batrachochytrium salamandrivorans TaxID=1357716 RepID=A0ABQ8F192_9FUNG|nr:hypothetical protein BASA62_009741 [Batrachochytrium salamandrivorans]KAH6561835.1 hypothetical protein BASA60_011339 [Batrachochytrium salamandrivorans]KAH6590280.1 hypothetical protein BASA50_009540 [Batrachochytrium salamandrivorans]
MVTVAATGHDTTTTYVATHNMQGMTAVAAEALDTLGRTSLSLRVAASATVPDMLVALSDMTTTAHSLESTRCAQTALLKRLRTASIAANSLAARLEHAGMHDETAAERMVAKWTLNKQMLESKRVDYESRLESAYNESPIAASTNCDLRVLDSSTRLAAQRTAAAAHRLASLQSLPADIPLAQLKLDSLHEQVRQRNAIRHAMMANALVATTSCHMPRDSTQ